MEIGIIVSVCVSLLLVIYKTAFPRITVLGKLPGTEIYRWVQGRLAGGRMLRRAVDGWLHVRLIRRPTRAAARAPLVLSSRPAHCMYRLHRLL